MTHSPNVEIGWYGEAQFSPARIDCPNPDRWHTHDLQAAEVEVIELVHGLIRGIQPDVCLETGTSRGFLAERIGDTLALNGQGTLYTYESEQDTWLEAQDRLDTYANVVSINEPSMSPWDYGGIDFAWFDSLLDLRWQEFNFYHPFMNPGAVICFHDTAPRFGQWSDWVRNDRRLNVIDLPTPRGVLIGRLA